MDRFSIIHPRQITISLSLQRTPPHSSIHYFYLQFGSEKSLRNGPNRHWIRQSSLGQAFAWAFFRPTWKHSFWFIKRNRPSPHQRYFLSSSGGRELASGPFAMYGLVNSTRPRHLFVFFPWRPHLQLDMGSRLPRRARKLRRSWSGLGKQRGEKSRVYVV